MKNHQYRLVCIEETNFTDLSALELDKLKDLYVESRLSSMTEDEFKKFVRVSIEDQIKGTVGKEEEKEAWLEMKEYFKDDFSDKILKIRQGKLDNRLSPEEEELEKRKILLEKRKKEQDSNFEDMW